MTNLIKQLAATGLWLVVSSMASLQLHAQKLTDKADFNIINLNYPGLEDVKKQVESNQYENAEKELLAYFRNKFSKLEPDFSNAENPPDLKLLLTVADKSAADSALLHKFKPQKGYGFFDYGKDINWQFWPVKDNELRWQLHRVRWWQSMALVYKATGDKRYAREWMLQFMDWVKKNQLGVSANNDKYAWRPLEVSDRVQSLVATFSIFLRSADMTPDFLMAFLKSYNQQVNYLPANYADKGNHRLFEAQRVLFAGVSFPEFKNAPEWRKSGVDVLNAEIGKQVYDDGMQFELSPVYHVAAIEIFLKAYISAKKAGMEKEFPASYKQTIRNMIKATISISFPDYQTPMFGDSWLIDPKLRMNQFGNWSKVFPADQQIKYFATAGKKGEQPAFLSNALKDAGFYTFRNGWTNHSTVMVLKASPPGAFHAQPDNGTFELWVKGRNFTPDAGVFVYSGDEEISALRNAYRQTRIHSTLTLNNRDMVITKAKPQKWETDVPAGTEKATILSYTNPSYEGLNHQRSVLFIDNAWFLVIDQAIGQSTGTIGTHFVLKEDNKPVFDKATRRVYTSYADGNNLLIQNLNADRITFTQEAGKVSYSYRKEHTRPAFVFEKEKTDTKPQIFMTILYPYSGNVAPVISVKENAGNNLANGQLDLNLTIDGKVKKIKASLE